MPRAPERTMVLVVLAFAALLHGRFLLGSQMAGLLVGWLPDDAFYYLQPAWNAARGHGLSFDGLAPTYGFQPLWTVLLWLGAALAPTKGALVGLALGLGAALHLLVGGLLFTWLSRAGAPRGGLVAATVWLLNPETLFMHASGMESGLVAALLLGVLIASADLQRRPIRLGVLLGLLFLARITMGMVAVLLLLAAWRRVPRRALLTVVLAAIATTLPWLLYATVALGQPLPLSMDRKLVAGIAGAARFVADLPLVPDGLIAALLPASERALVEAPGLIGPTWERLWLFGVRAPVGWALGRWLPSMLTLPSAILAVLWVLLLRSQGDGARTRWPAGIGVLAGVAVLNLLANNLLLSQFVEYGFWYRVPEVLLLVALVGVVADRALALRSPRALGGACLALLVVGVAHTARDHRPLAYDADARLVARGGYDVSRVLGDELPAGARVGCWNAGLIGWVADGPVIVNIDGLANTPEFVPIAAQEVLVRHGIEDELALLGWLEEQGIDYLVDLHPVDGAAVPFYGVIPPERVEVVLRSTPVDHWVDPGDHAITLVRLR